MAGEAEFQSGVAEESFGKRGEGRGEGREEDCCAGRGITPTLPPLPIQFSQVNSHNSKQHLTVDVLICKFSLYL